MWAWGVGQGQIKGRGSSKQHGDELRNNGAPVALGFYPLTKDEGELAGVNISDSAS